MYRKALDLEKMGKEKRLFRRYNRQIHFTITFGGTSIPAESKDYSVTGIGALLPGSTGNLDSLPDELLVHLTLSGKTVKMKGKVMWRVGTAHGLKVGIELIGPILGSLEFYRLSDLLVGLQRSRKEGTLEVRSGALVKKIYLKIFLYL